MTKPDREIMEILAAFDLTRCPWSAAQLAGCDPKTVGRYIAKRDGGASPFERSRRPRLIDPYLEKIEELVERSRGRVRADVVHDDHIVPMGFAGDERTTRRAVAAAKAAYALGRCRTYRPWVPEPGMWAGMLPAGQEAAKAFYRVVDAAYERRSVAVSSNLHPAGFDTIMPKTLATAAVDRLLHHAHLVVTEGNSHRLAEPMAGKGVLPLAGPATP